MDEQRKRGRPPKPEEEVRRHPIGVRTTRALKEKIEDAAAATGRSVAQEVEARLEQSFRPGAEHISVPLDLIEAMIKLTEFQTGERWNEDLMTWIAVKKLVVALLDTNRPAAPNQEDVREAIRAWEEQRDRWTDFGAGSGLKLEVLKGEPLLAPDAIEKQATARAELDEAWQRVVELNAPAKAMARAGTDLADTIAGMDLFRLRPRRDGHGA
jgi:hypothetical protein